MTEYTHVEEIISSDQIRKFAADHSVCLDFTNRIHQGSFRDADWRSLGRIDAPEQAMDFLDKRWGVPFRLELGAGKRNKDGPPWGKYPWATIRLNPRADPNCDIYMDLDGFWRDEKYYQIAQTRIDEA